MGDDGLRILVPHATARRLSRRRFLGLTGGGAAALALGATGCTAEDSGGSDEPDAAPLSFGQGEPAIGGALNLFSWDEYTSPENLDEFSARFDVEVSVETYGSNEEAATGLEANPGLYDIVVPTDAYIPGLIEDGLLAPLEHDLIPNMANVDPAFLGRSWDPENRYSVVKAWGSTGYLYDTTVVQEVFTSWQDFFRIAALPQVSGRVAAQPDVVTVWMALWSLGFDWRTNDEGELAQAEQLLVDQLLPHLAGLDPYPVDGMLGEEYVLGMFYSGDARTVVLEFPERYRWVLPEPYSDLWIDAWTIVAGTANAEAAHAFINFVLQPNVSARELDYHGYATAVLGIDEFLPFDLQARDMVFFDEAQLARMLTYEVPESEERRNQIMSTLQERLGT